MFSYTYDAWNRLVAVKKAYRDPDTTNVTTPYTVATCAYDGLHRRIVRTVQNQYDLDGTYHDYYDGQSVVEIRNGSDQVLKQQVWGVTYIDELVQIAINGDPVDDPEFDPGDADHDPSYYYALHNANYNVQLVVDATGVAVERYEYAPYGERTVYTSPGSNDPDCHAPTLLPQRVQIAGADQPYGICDVGFQGRPHCDVSGLIDHRYRVWNTRLGHWNQNDPLGYPDGANRRAGYHIMRGGLDPFGLLFKFERGPIRKHRNGKLERRFEVSHSTSSRTLNPGTWFSPVVSRTQVSQFVLHACPDVFWRHHDGVTNAHSAWTVSLNQMERDEGVAATLQTITHMAPYGEAADLALVQGDWAGAARSAGQETLMNIAGGAGGKLLGAGLKALGGAAEGLIGAAAKAKADDATRALGVLEHGRVEPISVGDALDRADKFLDLGTPIRGVDGNTGVQFVQSATNEAGGTITKRVGFDLNPDAPHVQRAGPHLNLQTQIDGKPIQSGPLADPHIPIDPSTIIHPGDYRKP